MRSMKLERRKYVQLVSNMPSWCVVHRFRMLSTSCGKQRKMC